MAKTKSPLRVLHLLSYLTHGGIEAWLMEMARKSDRSRIQFDVCQTNPSVEKTGDYEEEFRQLGGRVYRCPLRKNLLAFNRDFLKILSDGRYDILHSHHYLASGYFLRVASELPQLQLIAHLHPSVDVFAGQHLAFSRSLYRWLMKRWIYKYADAVLGASLTSLNLTWGPNWRNDKRFYFQPNGIDLTDFEQKVDPEDIRRELGLPRDSRIVVTVGRHVPHKNHRIIPDIAAQICPEHPDVYFVINGAGPLFEEVENRVKELGLEDRVRLVKGFPSIIPLWKSSDLFLFPSLQEGFGIVVIEAAAAGLPVVACRVPGVTESAATCHNATLMEPGATIQQWSEAVKKGLASGRMDIKDYHEFEKEFKFTTKKSLEILLGIYEQTMENSVDSQ